MFMDGADDNLMTAPQAAYAVQGAPARRAHECANNKHKHLRPGALTFVHEGKPDLHGSTSK